MIRRLSSDIALLFFCLAMTIYALWGAPTADHPGWVEVVILIFIIFSLGLLPFVSILRFNQGDEKPYWFLTGQFLFLFGLAASSIVTVTEGNGLHNAIRDLIGFIFLLVPLFLVHFLHNQDRSKTLLYLCLVIGLVFSLRTIFPDNIFNIRGDELLYLGNSPLVLFSSIFLIGYGAKKLFFNVTIANFFLFLILLMASIICLIAMMQDIRRASFVAFILSVSAFVVIGFIQNPVRALLPLALLGAVLIAFQQDIFNIIDQITLKTSQVGLNMRIQEWQAVWQAVNHDWITLLFGKGWGAAFESPAVGGLAVTFTHSLLSAVLLKAGVIGLLLCLVYLFFIFEKLVGVVFSNPIAGIALFWPFMIAVLFYASYKSLDFGLLLTLIVIWHKTKEQDLINE